MRFHLSTLQRRLAVLEARRDAQVISEGDPGLVRLCAIPFHMLRLSSLVHASPTANDEFENNLKNLLSSKDRLSTTHSLRFAISTSTVLTTNALVNIDRSTLYTSAS